MSQLRIQVSDTVGEVSARLVRPPRAHALLVLAHGAGAGMDHPFMEVMAEELAQYGVASLRYQFPYTERRIRRPDPKPVLLATVRAAVARARELAGGLALFAGGKSMGGRMTSLAAAEAPLPEVGGLVFFGFPLHPAGRPSSERAAHLHEVHLPLLFLQGTRDALADLELLRPLCDKLGARATLRVIEGADHSFGVLKRSGRDATEVRRELGDCVAEWTAARLARV